MSAQERPFFGTEESAEGDVADLPRRGLTALRPGARYGFDIEGHTVKVTIKRTYGLYDVEIAEVDRRVRVPLGLRQLQPGAEFNQKILYVWQGS